MIVPTPQKEVESLGSNLIIGGGGFSETITSSRNCWSRCGRVLGGTTAGRNDRKRQKRRLKP